VQNFSQEDGEGEGSVTLEMAYGNFVSRDKYWLQFSLYCPNIVLKISLSV
jgi:hypothetical protein